MRIYVCQIEREDGRVVAYTRDLPRALRWARLPEDTVLSPDPGDGPPPEPLARNVGLERCVYQADIEDDVDGHSDIWVAVDDERWHLWAGANLSDIRLPSGREDRVQEVVLRRVSGLED